MRVLKSSRVDKKTKSQKGTMKGDDDHKKNPAVISFSIFAISSYLYS
jgi:hypothetical protein